MYRPWIQANYDVTTSDGTHPYNIIQYTMAQVIAETMKRTPLLENDYTSYSITNNLTNATNDNTNTSVLSGNSYSANISAESGYVLSSVTVTMGGTDITSSAYSNGAISISSVTGDIVITATAVAQTGTTTYTVTNDLANVTSDNSATSVEEDSSYSATLTPSSGYTLDTVTVTMGGTDVTSTVYSNGVITITSVTGDIVITASGVEETSGDTVNPTNEAIKVFEGYYGVQSNTNYNDYVVADVRVGDVFTFATNWNAKTTTAICGYFSTLPDTISTSIENMGGTYAYIDADATNVSYSYGIATLTVTQDANYFMFPCHISHLDIASWEKVSRA